jgi:1,4-dihydroxy-2-naphthoate octaprenyltransferase
VFKTTLKKILKPFRLASLLATYALGLGLVQYVRTLSSWLLAIQGALFLLLTVLGVEALGLLARLGRQPQLFRELTLGQRRQMRMVLAFFSATLLTVATSLFIGWMIGGALWQGWTLWILAAVLTGILYYFTLVFPTFAPYRMLAEVLLFVILPPAIAFFTQSKDLHRLLTLTVIPFAAVYLAYPLLLNLKQFGEDYRLGRVTFATQIGWERTLVFHNALLLLAYLLFALIVLLDFPWLLLWPVFLTLPIGILEIWLMEGVRRGRRPLWRVMQAATASVYFIPLYLIGFAFWIR